MLPPGSVASGPEDETAEWAVGPHAWCPNGRYFPFPDAGDDDLVAALQSGADLVLTLQPWTTINVDGVATGFDDGDFVLVLDELAGDRAELVVEPVEIAGEGIA